MSDNKNAAAAGKESKTAQPFSEDKSGVNETRPGMEDAPHDRADAIGDAEKTGEMSKVTQRQE